VRVGDVICGVDGRDVIGEPVSVLRSLLLGHEGSYVVLTFARAVEAGAEIDADAVGNTVIAKFDVELMRGSPEYLARLDASRKYEGDLVDLRQQLKQALAEEKEIAEEVERVKRVLQLERGASARREKEMEDLRSSHQREVAALTEACRRAEQVPYAKHHSVPSLAPSNTDCLSSHLQFARYASPYPEPPSVDPNTVNPRISQVIFRQTTVPQLRIPEPPISNPQAPNPQCLVLIH